MRCATLNGTHLLSPLGEKCTLDYSIHLKIGLLISLKTHMQKRSDLFLGLFYHCTGRNSDQNWTEPFFWGTQKEMFSIMFMMKVKMNDTVKLEILKSITQLVYTTHCTPISVCILKCGMFCIYCVSFDINVIMLLWNRSVWMCTCSVLQYLKYLKIWTYYNIRSLKCI